MDTYRDWANEVSAKIKEKMSWVRDKNRDKLPYTTDENGNYDDRADGSVIWKMDDGINWWTNGFWGGIMWLPYQNTGDEAYAETARKAEEKLQACFNLFWGLHHDVGFMYMPTAVADYRLTKREESRKTAMLAANILAGRFNLSGRFIRAWNDAEDSETDTRGWAIIDCMFNISLLYWASEESGDPRFRLMAEAHADTVMQNFIRPDGSVCHIVEFDPNTGERIQSHGGQGYGRGSSWARGQAWALYGFVISYIHTKKKEYLDTAKKVAHYCIANIREDGLIPLDFRQPKEPMWEDSCAACIIAGGLIELSRCVPEPEQELYLSRGYRLLQTIAEKRAVWGRECDAIVQNCSGAYHYTPHHITMCYADYFFIEAVYKLAGTGRFMW